MRTREMARSDLGFAVECSRVAGRASATIEELEGSLLNDAQGCFIAENCHGPVGFCVAARYGKCGFLSAIARGGFRSIAIVERELLEQATAFLLNHGCDSIVAQAGHFIVPSFKSKGFQNHGRVLRFTGRVKSRSHQHIRAMKPQDLSAIGNLDKHCFRADRSSLLERRYSLTPRFCKIFETNGTIGGYIMAHKAKGVIAVGPWVVSSTVDCPMDLLEGLALEAEGERLFVEVLETNRGAVELLRAMGFVESPEWGWRMHLGPRTGVGLDNALYAIGSPFTG